MIVNFSNYYHSEDYKRVSDFLIAHHQPGNADGNWLEPMWEYMHFHPILDASNMEKFGIWDVSGKIVGIAHYELHLGEAFFQFHPAYRHLRNEMLDYAEANLTGTSKKDGRKYLCVYVKDYDAEFLSVVQTQGYERDTKVSGTMTKLDIPEPFPQISLPEGFHLTNLAEECDWAKVHRVLWRGFDHGDDVPMNEEEFNSRRKMFDTPKARRDLKIVVKAPDGTFVSFCGMFYEPTGRFAYVEPVATDPDYRRMGLGKAAVLEGIRHCAELGAVTVYVGSDLPIYRSVGFKKVYGSECWKKYF